MITKTAQLNRICIDYEVDILIESNGAVIFYKNTQESDIVPFDDEITQDYLLNNFEMVADMSKLQMNMYELSY